MEKKNEIKVYVLLLRNDETGDIWVENFVVDECDLDDYLKLSGSVGVTILEHRPVVFDISGYEQGSLVNR